MTIAPAASVVVPTHRRPERLRGCLGALAALEPPAGGFEVVVVADGLGDPGAGVAREAAGPAVAVRVVEQPQAGPAAARNRGAETARGRWVAFTDDDCRPRPGWLRALVAALEEAPERLVGGPMVNALVEDPGATASHVVLDVAFAHFGRADDPARFFPSSNVALERDAFLALGGFDSRFPLAAAEDRDLCDRARLAGHELVLVPEAEVDHHHALGLRRIWRQQHNYGRGAAVFERLRAQRGQPRLQIAPGFYRALAAAPFAGRPLGPGARLATLVALTQVAYLAGYVTERRRRPE